MLRASYSVGLAYISSEFLSGFTEVLGISASTLFSVFNAFRFFYDRERPIREGGGVGWRIHTSKHGFETIYQPPSERFSNRAEVVIVPRRRFGAIPIAFGVARFSEVDFLLLWMFVFFFVANSALNGAGGQLTMTPGQI